MTVLFVSDVHLSARRPARVEAFRAFVQGPARRADALYVLGDLFDAWLGDGDASAPHREVEADLAGLTGAGVPVYVMHGNHDFLLGRRFARRTGCRLLPEQLTVQVHGTPVLLMHGDSLCTDDTAYQKWRAFSRSRRNQAVFSLFPMPAKRAVARALRSASAEQTQLKTEQIMDVNPHAVREAMEAAGVRHLVHGHTHRPGEHAVELQGGAGTRIVLGDWYEGDSILAWEPGGYRLTHLAGLAGP